MKKYLFSLLTLFVSATMCLSLSSCGDDDDEGGGSVTTSGNLETPNYANESARYDVTSSNTDILSIELTESGDYIVIKTNSYNTYSKSSVTNKSLGAFLSKNTSLKSRASSSSNIITGKYTKTSDTEYMLTGWGKIAITGSTNDALSITVTPNNGSTYTVPVAKHTQNPSSSLTSQICRTWNASTFKVSGKEYDIREFNSIISQLIRESYNISTDFNLNLDDETPKQVIFTKSGTYMVKWTDGELGISTWTWENENRGILRYSWDYYDMYSKNESGYANVSFRGNQLEVTENLEFAEEAPSWQLTWYFNEAE